MRRALHRGLKSGNGCDVTKRAIILDVNSIVSEQNYANLTSKIALCRIAPGEIIQFYLILPTKNNCVGPNGFI